MKVIAAKSSGFCFGIRQAVGKAEELIAAAAPGERLIMLGELTHNKTVIDELCRGGFEVVRKAEDVPYGSTVIVRAHGVPPYEKSVLESRGCRIVDCTCPFVAKIHRIVREQAKEGRQIILTGGKGHPEVVGICGEAPQNIHVISDIAELDSEPFVRDGVVLISQTTFSSKIFDDVCATIENRVASYCKFDTICNTTENRQSEAARISGMVDAMVIIGSAHSSNTMKLYDICLSHCVRTYLVEDAADVRRLIADGSLLPEDSVGVTAGASTPEAIILEVVRTMDENKELMNDQIADVDFTEYIDSIPQLRRNSIVKGVITSADDDYVYVDVRDKSEGKIALKEFRNDPDFDLQKAIEEHAEVTVIVKSIRNTDLGKEIILSKSQLDFEKNKKVIEEAFEAKTPVIATITGVVKDGVIANFGGIDIYIHKTQIKIGEVNDLESYKGQQIEILITKVDTEKHRLRVSGSHRAIAAAERKAKADELWSTIEVGKRYKGIVRSIPNFGAFVDIGGVDGLVHKTELSWSKVENVSSILSVGDEIEVYVKSFDPETKKISLGYKKAEDDPYYNVEERIPVGSVVKGTVVRLTDFGAFVQLEPDLDALCHVSQISSTHLDKPSDVLSVGQEVIAKVTSIDTAKRRISISIKEVAPINPENNDEDIYSIADDAESSSEEA